MVRQEHFKREERKNSMRGFKMTVQRKWAREDPDKYGNNRIESAWCRRKNMGGKWGVFGR